MPCPRKMAPDSGKKYPVESVPAFPRIFFAVRSYSCTGSGLLMIPKPQKNGAAGKGFYPRCLLQQPPRSRIDRFHLRNGPRFQFRRIRDRHIFARQTADGFLKMENASLSATTEATLRAHAEVLYASWATSTRPVFLAELTINSVSSGKAFLGQAPPHRFRPARAFRPHGALSAGSWNS